MRYRFTLIFCGRDDSKNQDIVAGLLLDNDENLEELEKLAFISSCAIDSVKARGSVLIPMGRLGILLQLLENISCSLDSLNLKVIFSFSLQKLLL